MPFDEAPIKQLAVAQRDVIGGITTFLAMAYIVVVNPAILSTPGTGIPFSGAVTATVVLCFVMTMLMGLYAKLPFGVAPGMGLNAFFTFTIVLSQKVPWTVALGMVFWAGVLFLLISATKLRENIALAMPDSVRVGAGAGIGIFLSFIGLKSMGLIKADPVTLVTTGKLSGEVLLAVGGMFVGMALLMRRSAFAYVATIVGVTVVAAACGWVKAPESIWSWPDFQGTFFKLDPVSALKPQYLGAIFAITVTDLFDSISTFVGVSDATGLLTKAERPERLRRGLVVDAVATFGASLFGTSPGTAYIESAAGIQAGAKTGRASVVTALCFLPCLFLAPLVGAIPAYATAPILVLVGLSMCQILGRNSAHRLEEQLPKYLTMILIPLTFSITQGILWGIISHVVLFLLAGRRAEIGRLVWALAGVSIGLLWLGSAT